MFYRPFDRSMDLSVINAFLGVCGSVSSEGPTGASSGLTVNHWRIARRMPENETITGKTRIAV